MKKLMASLKNLLRALPVSFVILFLSSTLVSADDYRITSFRSDIVINKDASISVAEEVKVDFFILKHGIFREIPERNLEVLSVKNERGANYEYEVSGGNTKTIKIGNPNITIKGAHTYIILYKVHGAIKQFEDHELYTK